MKVRGSWGSYEKLNSAEWKSIQIKVENIYNIETSFYLDPCLTLHPSGLGGERRGGWNIAL